MTVAGRTVTASPVTYVASGGDGDVTVSVGSM